MLKFEFHEDIIISHKISRKKLKLWTVIDFLCTCILHEKRNFRKTAVINVEFKYWNKGRWINTQYYGRCFLKLPSHTGDITCLKRKSKKQLLKVSSHFLPAEIEHFSIREYSKSAIQSRKTEVSGLRCWPGATIFFHRELPTPLSEPWRGKYPIWYTDSMA